MLELIYMSNLTGLFTEWVSLWPPTRVKRRMIKYCNNERWRIESSKAKKILRRLSVLVNVVCLGYRSRVVSHDFKKNNLPHCREGDWGEDISSSSSSKINTNLAALRCLRVKPFNTSLRRSMDRFMIDVSSLTKKQAISLALSAWQNMCLPRQIIWFLALQALVFANLRIQDACS